MRSCQVPLMVMKLKGHQAQDLTVVSFLHFILQRYCKLVGYK